MLLGAMWDPSRLPFPSQAEGKDTFHSVSPLRDCLSPLREREKAIASSPQSSLIGSFSDDSGCRGCGRMDLELLPLHVLSVTTCRDSCVADADSNAILRTRPVKPARRLPGRGGPAHLAHPPEPAFTLLAYSLFGCNLGFFVAVVATDKSDTVAQRACCQGVCERVRRALRIN